MPSEQDLKNFSRLRAQGASMPKVVPSLPPLPSEVIKRFPELKAWEERANREYREQFSVALGWAINPE